MKKFIKNLMKQYDSMLYGMDYLRLRLEDGNELLQKKLESLDLDNSNMGVIQFANLNITFSKQQTPTGFGIIGNVVYNNISIPIIYYEEYLEPQKILTKSFGKVILYGAYFRLEELDFFSVKGVETRNNLDFCNWFIKSFGKCNITRIDYKIDFFNKEKEIKLFKPGEITKIRSNTKVQKREKGEEMESWRLGERKSKRYLIRGYNKLIDINKKGKMAMYGDYFEYKSVHRLEFEFLNHFCRNTLTGEKFKLNDLKTLLKKIKNFIEVNKTDYPIFESSEKVDLTDTGTRILYVQSTKGYIKGCISNRINIFHLIHECYKELGYNRERLETDFKMFSKFKKNIYSPEDYSFLEKVYKNML